MYRKYWQDVSLLSEWSHSASEDIELHSNISGLLWPSGPAWPSCRIGVRGQLMWRQCLAWDDFSMVFGGDICREHRPARGTVTPTGGNPAAPKMGVTRSLFVIICFPQEISVYWGQNFSLLDTLILIYIWQVSLQVSGEIFNIEYASSLCHLWENDKINDGENLLSYPHYPWSGIATALVPQTRCETRNNNMEGRQQGEICLQKGIIFMADRWLPCTEDSNVRSKEMGQNEKKRIHLTQTGSSSIRTQIARFMGPTWGPSGAYRIQVGPMLAQWTLLSGKWWAPAWDGCVSVANPCCD